MDKDVIKEKYIITSPIPVSIEGTQKILNQMKKYVCKIHNGSTGTGFFCKIPNYNNENQLISVLVTNNHVLNENDIEIGKSIIISLNDGKEKIKIKIDKSRKIFTSKILDFTFIEIKEDIDKINNFFELDNEVNEEDEYLNKLYSNKSIYTIGYQEGENVKVSYGLIKSINEKEILHLCSTKSGSSGSPIILLNNFKLIGIHYGTNKDVNYNNGIFIKYAINEFNNSINSIKKNVLKDNFRTNITKFKKIYEIKSIQVNDVFIFKKYLFTNMIDNIQIFSLGNFNLEMKITLGKKNQDKGQSNDKFHYQYHIKYIYLVTDKNYKNDNIKDIRIITNEYYISINLEDKKFKILNKLKDGSYISNLDIMYFYLDESKRLKEIGFVKKENNQNSEIKHIVDFNNCDFESFEINGKYLVFYSYARAYSKTVIFRMDNYNLIYHKRYGHWNHFHILDYKTLNLPGDIEYDKDNESYLLNLSNLSITKIDFIPLFKFQNNKYLGEIYRYGDEGEYKCEYGIYEENKKGKIVLIEYLKDLKEGLGKIYLSESNNIFISYDKNLSIYQFS